MPGNGEGRDDLITDADSTNGGPSLDGDTGELVAHDMAITRRLYAAAHVHLTRGRRVLSRRWEKAIRVELTSRTGRWPGL